MQIHRRGFLGLLGGVLAVPAAAASSPASLARWSALGSHRTADVVDVDLGTVLFPSLSIDYSLDGSSARWISSVRPTLGQRVRVAFGGDALFVGAIVRYTMQIDRNPALAPYWEVCAESDVLIADRWRRANPNFATI